jgi:glucokinase
MEIRGGIDLGGTKIQAVVVDESSAVLGDARRPTPKDSGVEGVARAMAETLGEALESASLAGEQPAGVGIGSPGTIDAGAGTVANAMNVVPEWKEPYPLGPRLGDLIGAPVSLGNDVQVATTAEFELGSGEPYRSLLGVFWGTGVGGGLILDGKPWLGRGAAGEIGHMVVRRGGARCTCGRIGCLEAYAGRRAMELHARHLHEDRGRHTDLFKIMRNHDRTRLSSGIWERALKEGDELAQHLIDRAVTALGAGIASAVNLLDVEAVVIGGGMGVRLGQPYVNRIVEAMHPHLFVDDRPPHVRLAKLGDLGGAIGAALLISPPAEGPAARAVS